MSTNSHSPYEVAVYYFPQYHPDTRNSAWHGQGWTEWDILKAARPRYPGHRQPIEPAWGYFNEADPAWTAREIDLAADHGITSFLYDWYWYDEKPFLHDALEKGFLTPPEHLAAQVCPDVGQPYLARSLYDAIQRATSHPDLRSRLAGVV